MSGPKVSSYDLEQQRKRQLAEEARRRQQQLEEQMRREREKRIAEQMAKVQKQLDEKKRASEAMLSSVSSMIEEEKKKQQEREAKRKAEEKAAAAATVAPREGILSEDDIPKAVDFNALLEQAKKAASERSEEEIDLSEIEAALKQEPVEMRSLLDAYLPTPGEEPAEEESGRKVAEKQTVETDLEFEELLMQMEKEYQEILRDRAFFKQQRDRIIHFEEICKRQQEYRSYQILRDVYYGEFSKLKKERTNWHRTYDEWKPVFEEAYIQYCASCQMLGREPEHYFLNVETVEEDVKKLRQESAKLQAEYLQQQETLAITTALNEVMAEMGYEVLGTRTIQKKTGGQVKNTIFSFGEGSGIHVMDSGERITMEIVGLDDGRPVTEEERDYLEEEQEEFCDSFAEIEEALKKKGVVLKNRISKLAPSKEYAVIMSMEGYEVTEESRKVKKLSKVDKKAGKKRREKKSDKKYIDE